jgi:hypothetical protein
VLLNFAAAFELNFRVMLGHLSLAAGRCPAYPSCMSTLAEIQHAALELSDDERAILMATLWESLPQTDTEDNVVEQRLKELADDPASEISHDDFLNQVRKDRSPAR